MGSFYSAQIADLVGIYIKYYKQNINQITLYRYDSLIYIPNSNGPKTSNLRNKIIKEFKSLGFKIQISNLKIANFLDMIFDLNKNSYKSFYKNNDIPL